LKVILCKDRFSAGGVLRDMLSSIGGLDIAAAVGGADLAITWLATHEGAWQVAVVVVEQDPAQMDVIAFARSANPHARIAAVGSIVCGAVRSECLRHGADIAFDSRRIGDLAAWLDQLRASPS
jgi:hypothetical protein